MFRLSLLESLMIVQYHYQKASFTLILKRKRINYLKSWKKFKNFMIFQKIKSINYHRLLVLEMLLIMHVIHWVKLVEEFSHLALKLEMKVLER